MSRRSRPLIALAIALGGASLASISASASASAKGSASASAGKPPSKASAVAATAKPSAGPPAPKTMLTPNVAAQKMVAGAPTALDAASGGESSELHALREAELDLFAGAAPPPGVAWPSDLPSAPKGPFALGCDGGLPPEPADEAPPIDDVAVGGSLSWLSGLAMPDLPVRWDSRVVRYLEFFKDDPRGRRIFALWWKRSGRYRELIQEQLRARSMPEDLAWVAMAESGFDPTIKSPAGAAGLWQFMPEAAKIYGLSIDRWADMRSSPIRATEAAIGFLSDLKKRFGTWELALAAYNMGYGGALSAVKKFNSNDYWALSRFENGLPWETTLYVPKIIAMAIVSRNIEAFGYDSVILDTSLDGDQVEVPAGSDLKSIASAAGCSVKELEALNPELRAGRVPPSSSGKIDDAKYVVVVPKGKATAVKDASSKLAPKSTLETYVVRFGESLDQIAAARKTTKAKLVELNGISKDEAVRSGTLLLVPPLPAGSESSGSPYGAVATTDKPTALVPGTTFAYPDRQRLFYRVIVGDTPRDVADAFGVTVDELRSWNAIEPTARLQEGMTLQLFVPKGADLSRVVAMKETDVKVIAVGSDEFYSIEEAQKGRKRATVYASGGETVEQVGKKYGLSAGSMEKINRRPRNDVLAKGEAVIVYVPIEATTPAPPAGASTATASLADLPAP